MPASPLFAPLASPDGEPQKLPSPASSPPEPEPEPEIKFIIPDLSEAVRARIRETDYGRACGWIIEYKGEPIATLTNYRYADMFWEYYDVTLLIEDETILEALYSRNFYFNPEVVFRNREFPDIPSGGGILRPLGGVDKASNTALVRALRLIIDQPIPQPRPTPQPPMTFWQRVGFWAFKVLLGSRYPRMED